VTVTAIEIAEHEPNLVRFPGRALADVPDLPERVDI
jgi:hypothetical protein